MKKLLVLVMAAAIVLSGCGADALSAETPVPSSAPAPAPEPAPSPTPEPSPTPPEGEIFLNVSSITFSTVGESENIYAGTAPAESVSWSSGDPAVVSVENGVLTARGVGSTTVTAEFMGQSLSCAAGCLAEDEEALGALPEELRRSPRRLPPVLASNPTAFFDDALIMGDSISYMLSMFESKNDLLGNVMFLTRGGTSLLGIQHRSYNIYYQGQDMAIEDSVHASGRHKLFLMLGQNDLGYREIGDTLESYRVIIERIREKSPDIEIYIQTLVHEWCETGTSNSRNEKIDEFNEGLEALAVELDCHFLDIRKYIEDHMGTMAAPYNMDYGIHVNEAGCIEWMRALNAYAYMELMEETA